MLVCSGLLASCIPVRNDRHAPNGYADIRVPATAGLTVTVSLQNLVDADPAWNAVGQHPAAIGVRFRGRPVSCTIVGADDGRVDLDDVITFTVGEPSRHSPWLNYRIVRHDVLTGDTDAEPLPDHVGCAVLPERAWRPNGRPFAAEVHRPDPAPEPNWPKDLDYVAIGPKAWLSAAYPLLEHRARQGHVVTAIAAEDIYARFSHGNPDPEAIREALQALWKHSGRELRYVLLMGDVEREYKPSASAPTPVPTFYRKKIRYPGYVSTPDYPTDHPYAVMEDQRRPTDRRPEPQLAVGRLPARDRSELSRLVAKVIGYENDSNPGAWQRRLVLFGGPANYGAFIDRIIESQATWLLNDVVPYDFDLDFVFAKPDSPYTWRPDRLGKRLATALDRGALFAAYFGHGLERAFDNVFYRGKFFSIGRREDLAAVDIPNGSPFFFSFTCHTGAYDGDGGEPSLAEVLAMNPRGPVAVFASSRASHPYNNALYAQGFIQIFLDGRPKTLGDGLLALKKDAYRRRLLLAEALVQNDIGALKREHVGLYNLLGDPATRIPYPARLPISVEPRLDDDAAPGGVRAGGQVRVTIAASPTGSGTALLTLETERATIRERIVPPETLEALPLERAFETMTQNHARAINKVVSEKRVPMGPDPVEVVLTAPTAPGRYVVKVLAEGSSGLAAGHTHFVVAPPRVAQVTEDPTR